MTLIVTNTELDMPEQQDADLAQTNPLPSLSAPASWRRPDIKRLSGDLHALWLELDESDANAYLCGEDLVLNQAVTAAVDAIRADEGYTREDHKTVDRSSPASTQGRWAMTTTLTPSAQEALTTILNLRKLTQETGTATTRAQNDILRALNGSDIAAIANALARQK